jgi:hypothetical protein
MGPKVLDFLVGFVLIPAGIFLLALLLLWYRDRRGMTPLPPRVVSALILLCTLISWLVTGTRLLAQVLAR